MEEYGDDSVVKKVMTGSYANIRLYKVNLTWNMII